MTQPVKETPTRQSPAAMRSGDPADVYAVRDAEAAALGLAGADEQTRREADAHRRADLELLDAMQRRQAAEELAIAQAQQRAQAETAAEAVAAERSHGERMLQLAARARVDAEQRALADARRRELAVAELTRAAQARLATEQEAEAIARQRAESERHAADLATEKIRAERALEATAMARAAAERDAAQQAARRQRQEDEATAATRARICAEQEQGEARSESLTAMALAATALEQHRLANAALAGREPERPAPASGRESPSLTPRVALLRYGLALVIGTALGYGLSYPGGATTPDNQGADPRPLKLDQTLRQPSAIMPPASPVAESVRDTPAPASRHPAARRGSD